MRTNRPTPTTAKVAGNAPDARTGGQVASPRTTRKKNADLIERESKETLLGLLRMMLLGRRFEERALRGGGQVHLVARGAGVRGIQNRGVGDG